MTDAELIARLRDFDKVTIGDARVAADRIEDLTAENAKLHDHIEGVAKDTHKIMVGYEAKLEKAVAAAGKMLDAFCVHEDSHQSAAYEAMCAALAETERESHDPL